VLDPVEQSFANTVRRGSQARRIGDGQRRSLPLPTNDADSVLRA
jgi:hypothetical protein